eukprot:UN04995
MVNAALSILMADISGGVVGFVISTVAIVIFGEIIPQAACSRYALYIGARTVRLVRILMALLAVAAFPISLVLDYALGPEFGNMYNNLELKKLIALHKEDERAEMDDRTAKVLEGALNFHDQSVEAMMTPWSQVFKLDITARLNFDTLMSIFKKGHSRIPVVQEVNGQEQVAGLLIVKDLILIDPEDEIPVSTLLEVFDHEPLRTWTDVPLAAQLSDFQKGLSHLAIVVSVDNEKQTDPVYQIQGIITLEDIIEVILQENIVDETDVFVSMRSKAKINRSFDFDKLALFDTRKRAKGVMFSAEANAVYHHLVKSVKVLTPGGRLVRELGFKNLLSSIIVLDVKVDGRKALKPVDDGGLLLYEHGKATEYFSLILEGRVEVLAGRDGFRSELARWSMFGAGVLENCSNACSKKQPYLDFVPDFTCKVLADSRILRISKDMFIACINGKYDKLI